MEPEFNLLEVRIIFADQFLTVSLLTELWMGNTCVLHGDFHHLLNKVEAMPHQEASSIHLPPTHTTFTLFSFSAFASRNSLFIYYSLIYYAAANLCLRPQKTEGEGWMLTRVLVSFHQRKLKLL
jgi:hypothetical protein